MKKIVLSVLVAGSLLATSCKEVKKGASDLKDATVETAGAAVDVTTNAAGAVVDGATNAANSAVDATTNAAGAVVDGATNAANAVVDKASNAVTSALGGISIPSFSNEAVTKNLTDYAAYAKDYIAANGNVAKIAALAPKGAALVAKGKELASKLDVSEMAKYKSVLSAIQSKISAAK